MDAKQKVHEQWCEIPVASFHNDEELHFCGSKAVREVFTVSGEWRKACESHSELFGADRRRELPNG